MNKLVEQEAIIDSKRVIESAQLKNSNLLGPFHKTKLVKESRYEVVTIQTSSHNLQIQQTETRPIRTQGHSKSHNTTRRRVCSHDVTAALLEE